MHINNHKKGSILYKYIVYTILFSTYQLHCDLRGYLFLVNIVYYLLGIICNNKSNFANLTEL